MEENRGGQGGVDRRGFVKTVGLGVGGLATLGGAKDAPAGVPAPPEDVARLLADADWPSLKHYDAAHLARIALPIGGIGTGTVSLGGRGDLRDFELMNRPAKGFVPTAAAAPFFAVRLREAGRPPVARVLEGPLPADELEGSHGSPAPNAGLPRFRSAAFASAYPFGRVLLTDPDLPVEAHLKAMNPLVPADAEASGLPIAVFRVELRNHSTQPVEATVCASLPNFVGMDGSKTKKDWKGDPQVLGAAGNRNAVRRTAAAQGLFLTSEKVDPKDPAWGSIALVTAPDAVATARTGWAEGGWSGALLDFWDDFLADGRLDEREAGATDTPMASLAVSIDLAPGEAREALFLLAWHFPNRISWTPKSDPPRARGLGRQLLRHAVRGRLGRRGEDAAAPPRAGPPHGRVRLRVRAAATCPPWSRRPRSSTSARCARRPASAPPTAASTAGRAARDNAGCCHGSCTHVWNYEQATPFLFGELSPRRCARSSSPTPPTSAGLMSFRVNLPLGRAQEFGQAAADGQMGCIMKMYRDWQLSGDEALLRVALAAASARPSSSAGSPAAGTPTATASWRAASTTRWTSSTSAPTRRWACGTSARCAPPRRWRGTWATPTSPRRAGDLFERGARLDRRAPLQRRVLRAPASAPPKSKDDVAPGLLRRHGRGRPDEARLPARRRLPRGPARRPVHGPRLRPRAARRSRPRPRRRCGASCATTCDRSLHDHFNHMRTFALGDESALAHGRLPEGPAGAALPLLQRGHDRLRVRGRGGHALRGAWRPRACACIRAIRDRYDGAQPQPLRRGRVRPPLRPRDGELGGRPRPDRLPLVRGHGHARARRARRGATSGRTGPRGARSPSRGRATGPFACASRRPRAS